MGEVDVGQFSHFCELPDDLTEDILAWLPVDYICRFSRVCNKWKALFSSTRFITTEWRETPPNKHPLLMLVAADFHLDSFAYSSFTQSWKSSRLSLSSLQKTEGAAFFVYIASGAGLFLIGSVFTDSIFVSNPLTGKCFTLSHLTFGEHYLKGELGIVQEGKDGYKVVVVHRPGTLPRHIVEIYDSSHKAWNTAGAFQENLTLHSAVKECGGLVFSGLNFFYSLALSGGVEGIVRFNMLEGTCIFVPLPPSTENNIMLFSYLVSCGSRILLAAEMNNRTALFGDMRVVIWEFIGDAVPKWELIATMPPTVLERRPTVRELRRLLHCAGMRDRIYFRFGGFGWKQIAVYNLAQNSWSVLPDCTFPGAETFDSRPPFGFAPRLDMNVD